MSEADLIIDIFTENGNSINTLINTVTKTFQLTKQQPLEQKQEQQKKHEITMTVNS